MLVVFCLVKTLLEEQRCYELVQAMQHFCVGYNFLVALMLAKKDTLLLGWQMVDTPRFIYQINLDWNSVLRRNINKGADSTKYRKAKRFAWTMEKAPSALSGRKKPALPCHEMGGKKVSKLQHFRVK